MFGLVCCLVSPEDTNYVHFHPPLAPGPPGPPGKPGEPSDPLLPGKPG